MTTQEIADYLEKQGYPMNTINDLSSNGYTLVTGIKGGYLFHAAILAHLYSEEEITPELLDRLITQRKNATT